ncbi:MAG TPA: methyltransferase domain-containing protein [Trichormus sp.]
MPSNKQIYIELFVISAVLLFLELAFIRLLGALVVVLTIFSNIVLLGAFFGMSLGCLVGNRKVNLIKATIPASLLTIVLAGIFLIGYFANTLSINVGDAKAAQNVVFGIYEHHADLAKASIPAEAVATLFFTLTTLIFAGLGQEMGRAFTRLSEAPLKAYVANISGSICGILAFAAVSFLQVPPVVWLSLAMTPILYWSAKSEPNKPDGQSAIKLLSKYGQPMLQVTTLIISLAVTYVLFMGNDQYRIRWSPYYEILFDRGQKIVAVNNMAHQQMYDILHDAPLYSAFYDVNRNSKNPSFDDVMIIGAGSGNDVASALAHGAKHVDAVEIDPEIQKIGRDNHPNHPYQDSRVTLHLTDGRQFALRQAKSGQYDLAEYAVVDSLVTHSGFASLRLESFLFTQQAFESIKRVLKPGGFFVMYNEYRQPWIVGRLVNMATQVFGTKPVVLFLPQITDANKSSLVTTATYLIVTNGPSEALERIRASFKDNNLYWINHNPSKNGSMDGFHLNAPDASPDWWAVGPSNVPIDTTGPSLSLPSDSWPFLYLKEHALPDINLRGMLLIALLSVAIMCFCVPVRKIRWDGQMFFLGAGFMLIETKSVVHLSLLFGSTWLVNTAVFTAILVMILLSNLFVLRFNPKNQMPFYIALFLSLLVNLIVSMETFLALPGVLRVIASASVTVLPIVFAGVIFALAFKKSKQPEADLAANVLGALIGGLSENFSLIFGFNNILFIAVLFYALSYFFGRKTEA